MTSSRSTGQDKGCDNDGQKHSGGHDAGRHAPSRSRRPISDLTGVDSRSDTGRSQSRLHVQAQSRRSELPQPRRAHGAGSGGRQHSANPRLRRRHSVEDVFDAPAGGYPSSERGTGVRSSGAHGSGAHRAVTRDRGVNPVNRPGGAQGRNWGLLGGVVVLGVVSVMLLLSVFSSGDDDSTATGTADSADTDQSAQSGEASTAKKPDGTSSTLTAPVPGSGYEGLSDAELPPGGPIDVEGSGNYLQIGKAGEKAGKGEEKTYTYVIEVEDTINQARYGGNDAFAATVDSILSNPKSWIGDSRYAFKNIGPNSADKPDMRIQLSSSETAAELCGDSYGAEVSCFYSDGDRVIINEARWVRGAVPFHGDLGSYRQYVVNHEVGHGLGYATHVQCHADGSLAPIMMQQSLSLNNHELYKIDPNEVYEDNNDTCRPNGWVFPLSVPEDQREADQAASGDQEQ